MGCSSSSSAEVKLMPQSPIALLINTPSERRPDQPSIFTEREIEILKNSWSDLNDTSDLSGLGKRVFLQAFEMRPEMKKVFPFGDCWGDDLLKHPKFLAHAQSFMVIIDNCVEHIDDEELDYMESVFILGQSHADRTGFTRENVEIFLKSILVVWHDLLKTYDGESEAIWSKFLSFVIEKMRSGYDDAQPRGCSTGQK